MDSFIHSSRMHARTKHTHTHTHGHKCIHKKSSHAYSCANKCTTFLSVCLFVCLSVCLSGRSGRLILQYLLSVIATGIITELGTLKQQQQQQQRRVSRRSVTHPRHPPVQINVILAVRRTLGALYMHICVCVCVCARVCAYGLPWPRFVCM